MSLATTISVVALALGAIAVPTRPASKNGVQRSSKNTASTVGKRGLAYNDAALCDLFIGDSEFSFAYNWDSNPGGLESGVMYVPLLWSTASGHTGDWNANAQQGIANGASVLFSFNEPDNTGQANMTPQQAASGWMEWMEPFAGQASLCAPAVTNGVGTNSGGIAYGFDWIDQFLSACTDCTIDCINVHWYADARATAYFEQYIANATSYGKPVYLTEFGALNPSGAFATGASASGFLETVLPQLDSNSGVAGYAYYYVSPNYLVSGGGNEPSDYGYVYANYTGSS